MPQRFSAFLRAGGDQEDRAPLRLFSRTVQKGNPFGRRRAEMVPFLHSLRIRHFLLLASCTQHEDDARPHPG